MIHISRKVKLLLATLLNIFLLAFLFTVVTRYADSLLLTLLSASLTHISVCGSLLYFLYISPADDRKPAAENNIKSNFSFVPISK